VLLDCNVVPPFIENKYGGYPYCALTVIVPLQDVVELHELLLTDVLICNGNTDGQLPRVIVV
jgi:hypothetical protein